MRRRQFLKGAAAGGALAASRPGFGNQAQTDATATAGRTQSLPPMRMHVGTQRRPTDREILEFCKRHGVDHVCGYPLDPSLNDTRRYWTLDELERARDLCEQHGISLDMVTVPLLWSRSVDIARFSAIMLADDPERDRDIEHIQDMIRHCARAGVPAFKYNMNLLGVLRTEPTPGRGGSRYSTWRLAEAGDRGLTRAGIVNADEFWARIEYFLDRIIPVCDEYGIRAACHPHDPGVPPEGFQGVARVLGTVDGLKRFVSLHDSEHHGLNFCVGSVSEMLEDPARDVYEVVRYFGERDKLFNIHMRNIRGRRDDFQEVYIDEGDIDVYRVLMTLRDTGYPYMVMPDHVPGHPDDPGRRQGFAHAFGYLQGIMSAVGRA